MSNEEGRLHRTSTTTNTPFSGSNDITVVNVNYERSETFSKRNTYTFAETERTLSALGQGFTRRSVIYTDG